MILGTLKFLVALYFFSNLITISGPPKMFFEQIDFKFNSFLISLRQESVRTVLWSVNKILSLFTMAFFGLLLVAVYFFHLPPKLLLNFTSALGISLLVSMSIPWNLDHKNSIKKYFFQPFMLLVPLSPLLALALSYVYGIDFFMPLREPYSGAFNFFGNSDILFSLGMSGILFIIHFVIPYVIFWLLFFPLFYVLMLSIKIFQIILDYIHNYINPNIFIVIMGIASVVLSVL